MAVLGRGSALIHLASPDWGCTDVGFGIGHCASCWSRVLGEATLNEPGDLTKGLVSYWIAATDALTLVSRSSGSGA
jgi:hypothetical protein